MVRDQRCKRIYYPVGNALQLFDLDTDPDEMNDLQGAPEHAGTIERLTELLRSNLYGSDERWITAGALVGEPKRRFRPGHNRELSLTRGLQWPVPPVNPEGGMKFFPEAPDDWDGNPGG